MKVEQIDVDQIWRDIGAWGKYTWKQIASYLFICVSWVIHQLTIVFIGYRPNYQCASDPAKNESILASNNVTNMVYGECVIKTYYNTSDGQTDVSETKCIHGWEYDIPREQSFVTEWDFFCENAELAELTQSLLIFGMMFGTFLWPMLADKYGRKPVMVLSHITLFVIVMATAFSPNYYVFLVLRILTGCVSQGALSGTTLSLEALPTESRSIEESLALIMWTTAICIMAPIAYLLRNVSWRYLQITFALMSAWSLFQWWMLDESLRWLLANGKIDRAKQVLKNACRWNNKDYDVILQKSGLADVSAQQINMATKQEPEKTQNGGAPAESDSLVEEAGEPVVEVPKYSCLEIIKNTTVLKVSLIIWFMWITDSLVYYGLFMTSSKLYGDRYVNFFLSGVIEYPAAIFLFWSMNALGRKWTSMICHLGAAFGLIVGTALRFSADDDDSSMLAASTAFTLIGKMAVTGAFTSSYVFTPELYPTNMRNTGLGIAAFMGKLGGIIAPFFRNVTIPWVPGAVFSIMNIITVILLAYVPETNGIDLPQTMEELSAWYKVNKFSFKIGKNEAVDKTGKRAEPI